MDKWNKFRVDVLDIVDGCSEKILYNSFRAVFPVTLPIEQQKTFNSDSTISSIIQFNCYQYYFWHFFIKNVDYINVFVYNKWKEYTAITVFAVFFLTDFMWHGGYNFTRALISTPILKNRKNVFIFTNYHL